MIDSYPERVPEGELMLESEVEHLAKGNLFVGMNHPFMTYLKQLCPGLSGGKALEIGCGTAQLSAHVALHYRDFSVCGVDLSQELLDRAQEFIEFLRIEDQVSLLRTRLPSPQVPENNFDLIVSRSTLHHFQNPLDFWRTVKLYMKENGSVLVQDLVRPTSSLTLTRLVSSAYRGLGEARRRSYLAAFRPDEIKDQLKEVGLEFAIHQPERSSQMFIYKNSVLPKAPVADEN